MNMSQTDLLKTARQRLQWSQRDLAQRLGVTPGYIALLEQAARSPSADLWLRITNVFHADARARDLFPVSESDHVTIVSHTNPTAFSIRSANEPEFPVEFPFDPLWLARIPFTVVAGAAGRG